MASYRHLARICVMKTLFSLHFKENPPREVLDAILDEFAPKLTERDFVYKTIEGILEHKDEILNIIQKYAPQWPIEKIAKVDRSLLEIGTYEIMFSEEVPPIVAINEAVEIAKKFGDVNSPKFVNGVLSSVMQSKNDKK